MVAAGRSPHTIRTQRHYLTHLRDTIPEPWKLTRADLESVLARGDWSPETRKSARSALRCFTRWAHATGRLPDDPGRDLPGVKVPPAAARPAPELLVRRLAADTSRVGRMCRLAGWYGLRRGEIAQVHHDDFDGDALLVHGKGGKSRLVPIVDNSTAAWLRGLDG